MNKIQKISVIGSQMDLGAVRKGVDMGPLAIRHAGLISRMKDMRFDVRDQGDVIPDVAEDEGNPRMRYEKEINGANERLYFKTLEAYEDNRFPVILGGDHSIAAGSVSASLTHLGKIGIIWVDAHADFNDDKITPSGNIHGMPLSSLCGLGPDSLVRFSAARASTKNVVIVGARSIDPDEKDKLREAGVTVFSISDVHGMGIRAVMQKAVDIASEGTKSVHLSFDMDALDPVHAPGVGTPVLNGLTQREAFIICEMIHDSGYLRAIDIVETNPLLDDRNMTGTLASELVMACLGSTDYVLLGN